MKWANLRITVELFVGLGILIVGCFQDATHEKVSTKIASSNYPHCTGK
jgi:hypothetical protein